MKEKRNSIALALALLAYPLHGEIDSGESKATPWIINGAGEFELIDNPDGITVGQDSQGSPNLFAFSERQGVLHGEDIVDSHYVMFDPETPSPSIGVRCRGWIRFSGPILAIYQSPAEQFLTRHLGLCSVNYLYPAQLGLEQDNSFAVDPDDPSVLLVDTTASTPGDYVRVVTEHQ